VLLDTSDLQFHRNIKPG